MNNDNNDNKLHSVDMMHMYEAFIAGHEETLKEELQSGNFGEDFADAIYICRKLFDMVKSLQAERDEAWLSRGSLLNEIDFRIEHGADSNGHLEAIRALFSQRTLDKISEIDEELGL